MGTIRQIKKGRASAVLTIGERSGTFPGMLSERRFLVRLAGTDEVKVIQYKGTSTSVSTGA